jgi:hypothetical protein
LTSAGVIHGIFGLSHQTHPLDRSRAALQALLGQLRQSAAAGADDAQLRALIEAAQLPALRAENRAAPKNEAWLPVTLGGRLTLVEPQQTSDTTYSLADFYTPFVWSDDRLKFRKGDPARGLSASALAAYLDGVDLAVTPVEHFRRAPVLVPAASHDRAALHRLVDEPADWPFFTAYRLDLDGSAGAPASWRGDHPPGVFQQWVVLTGEVTLAAAGRTATLDPARPAFIPATLDGGYQLSAAGPASLLVFSVPGARA